MILKILITGKSLPGTTERGSSGSPLFNKMGQIVGTLRGGFASCETKMGSDYYGALVWGWKGDGTPKHQLAQYLDPDNKTKRILPGMRLNEARSRSPLQPKIALNTNL